MGNVEKTLEFNTSRMKKIFVSTCAPFIYKINKKKLGRGFYKKKYIYGKEQQRLLRKNLMYTMRCILLPKWKTSKIQPWYQYEKKNKIQNVSIHYNYINGAKGNLRPLLSGVKYGFRKKTQHKPKANTFKNVVSKTLAILFPNRRKKLHNIYYSNVIPRLTLKIPTTKDSLRYFNKKLSRNVRFPAIYQGCINLFRTIRLLKWWHKKNNYQKNKHTWYKIEGLLPKLISIQEQYSKINAFYSAYKQNHVFAIRQQRRLHISNKQKLFSNWIAIKDIKRSSKAKKIKEQRQLKWMGNFYRNFGFYNNKKRRLRNVLRTKKYIKFKLYDNILQLSRHKKKIRTQLNYPIQSIRFRGPSYHKVYWQLTSYWKNNYFSHNFTRKKIAKLVKKSNKQNKKKVVSFISRTELTLSSLLLRMRLLNTSEMAHQFIRHGNVYINYNKIFSPSYIVQPGDTLSMYINLRKQRYHRFHDPIYTKRSFCGLYRKNTGRQSLLAQEQHQNFIKISLNNFDKWKRSEISSDKAIISDIKPFKIQDRMFLNKNKLQYDSTKVAAWKLGFLSNTITDVYTQQCKRVNYISRNLA